MAKDKKNYLAVCRRDRIECTQMGQRQFFLMQYGR